MVLQSSQIRGPFTPLRGTLGFLALLLLFGIGLRVAPPALAHDSLTLSVPAAGQRIVDAPSHIELQFSASLMDLGFEIRVVDADSKDWSAGAARLKGDKLVQPLARGMTGGEYQVRWRVVSSDGHPINGAYSFLVGPAAQPGSIPTVAGAGQESAAVSDTAAAPARPFSVWPPWVGPALFGACGGLVLYLIYIAFSSIRRRSRAAQD